MCGRQLPIVLCLMLLVTGCGRTSVDDLALKLEAGDYDGVVAAAGDDPDPVVRFVVSVAEYFRDDSRATNANRKAALSSDTGKARVRNWIAKQAGDQPSGPMDMFLKAVGAQMYGDHGVALEWYARAAAADPDESRFRNCLQVLDTDLEYSASIPEDAPLTYEGTQELSGSTWRPRAGEFRVTGGTVVTSFGTFEGRATFGDWVLLESDSGSPDIGWAALLTEGELILPRPFELGSAAGGINVTAAASYRPQVFDFFGKYRIVRLSPDKGETFPMIPIQFVHHGLLWSARCFLSETVRLEADHTYSFIQRAFFPMIKPMGVNTQITSAEKGLDWMTKIDFDNSGGVFFEERKAAYRLEDTEGLQPLMQTIDDRWRWTQDTHIMRMEIFSGKLWGKIQPIPVVR